MSRKISISFLLASVCLMAGWWLIERSQFQLSNVEPVAIVHPVSITETVPREELPPKPEEGTLLPPKVLIADVPFTVQAPDGQWSDPLFQDACEEASLLMADAWIRDIVLTKKESTERISSLAQYQKKLRGHSVDTSIDDTARLLKDFFEVTTGVVERGITVRDIKEVLANQQIVIVPTDGRKLKNPNFKQPGPSRHMLVLVGYDDATKEFMTNDPGTRKGEGYRYDQAVLFDAILDYATGRHEEVTSTDKVMLWVARP